MTIDSACVIEEPILGTVRPRSPFGAGGRFDGRAGESAAETAEL